MKRSFNIIMALMLSFMVVYMSVGTTIVHCLRFNKVMVGAVDDCCMKRGFGLECSQEHHHGSQVKKHCMDVKQVKLSSTLSVQQVEFNAAPVFAGILPSRWMVMPRPVACNVLAARFRNISVPHSPPRAYLRLLDFLII